MDEPTAGQDYQNYMNFMDSILQMPGFAPFYSSLTMSIWQ